MPLESQHFPFLFSEQGGTHRASDGKVRVRARGNGVIAAGVNRPWARLSIG